MNVKPIIYLAHRENYDSLSNLDKEIHSILKIISNQNIFEAYISANASIEDIYEFGDNISIFHYADHVSSEVLNLHNNELQSGYQKGLINVLSALKNLNLVFLNGVSSKRIVQMLLESGVKAVIATSRLAQDNIASEFAIQFYKHFLAGKSILNSFENAVSFIIASNVLEDMPTTRYLGSIQRESDMNKFPWGLYMREENSEVLDWKILAVEESTLINLAQQSISEKIQYIKSCVDGHAVLYSKILGIEEKYSITRFRE